MTTASPPMNPSLSSTVSSNSTTLDYLQVAFLPTLPPLSTALLLFLLVPTMVMSVVGVGGNLRIVKIHSNIHKMTPHHGSHGKREGVFCIGMYTSI